MAALNQIEVGYPGQPAGSTAEDDFILNQSADAVEVIFQVPSGAASYTITKLGYNNPTISGGGSPPVYKISLQGVDTSGNSDGTIKGGGSPASTTFTPTSSFWTWKTLDNSYAASPGEFLALVIKYDSGTIGGNNNTTVRYAEHASGENFQFPYVITNDNGTRTRSTNAPIFGWATAGTEYGYVDYGYGTDIWSSSGTNEYGMRFTLPAGTCGSYQVAGIRVKLKADAGASIQMTLYDTDGSTALQQVTIDGDYLSAAGTSYVANFYFDEATLSALVANSVYRIGLKALNANQVYMVSISNLTNADVGAYPFGTAWYRTYYSGGAWTDDNTTRPYMGLLLADVTVTPANKFRRTLFARAGSRGVA